MPLRLVAILLFLANAATASDRVALVVGMSDYSSIITLKNAGNDAAGISETLANIGFGVTTLLDVSGDDLRREIDAFTIEAETADLALVYFAGHGVEVEGKNFLIPVDADIMSNQDIERQAVSLDDFLAAVDRARKMRIVILDSCRDDPFGDRLADVTSDTVGAGTDQTRSAGRAGLAKPSPDRGTLVAFAARDGEKAFDGNGKHSPFAMALMENLSR